MQNIDVSKTVLAELESCERDMQEGFQMLAHAVARIRDGRLYLSAGYASFEEYCEKRWNWSRRRGYQIAGASVAILALPEDSRPLVSTERQARALAAVPEAEREEVLTKAAKTGKVTAKAITDAASKATSAKPEKVIHRDKTGYPIPDSILEDWKRAEAFGATLRSISEIKCAVDDGIKDGDFVLFAEINNSTVATLKNAYSELAQVIPYAVCSTCQGHNRANCTLCRRRGFLSKFKFETCVPEDLRKMREAKCKR